MSKEKKRKATAEALAKAHLEGATRGRVPIEIVRPNDWNMNKMAPAERVKLTHGMKTLHAKTGKLPPIIVRPHPTESGHFQIIDGFHRWDIIKQEEIDTEIDICVLDVDTKTAMILTETLNYLRGEADPDLQVKFFQTLNTEFNMPVTEIAEFVPNSADEITDLFNAYAIQIINVDVPTETVIGERDDSDMDDDVWVEVKFHMPKAAAEIVEGELARIGSLLTGKNVRGRALEFMAVNSSQTDIENLTGEPPDEPISDTLDASRRHRLKDLKARLKDKNKEKRAP